MVSSITFSNKNSTQIQIIEKKYRRHQHYRNSDEFVVIESKLVISNALSSQHTGKYSCAALIEHESGIKRMPVTTNEVYIKIVDRAKLGGASENDEKSTIPTSARPILPKVSDFQYCDEIIVQTYHGVYKWPRTVANTKLTQRCLIGHKTNNDTVSIECGLNGNWSDHVDFQNCLFESNLTQYLYSLSSEGIFRQFLFIFPYLCIDLRD